MSAKSDRDNRSNQLNPNNSAYELSRGGSHSSDDDDSPPIRRRRMEAEVYAELAAELSTLARPRTPTHSTYTLAVVAFNGKVRHVRFCVNTTRPRGFNAADPQAIITSLWDAYLEWVKLECPLGVAYARIWGPDMRSLPKPVWFSPKVGEHELVTACPGMWIKPVDLERARAWYGGTRDLAAKYEHACDWQNFSDSEDLGELKSEIPFGAPSPYL